MGYSRTTEELIADIDRIADRISGESDWDRLWKLVQKLPEPIQSLVVVVAVRETPLTDGGTVGDLLTEKGRDALEARLKWSRGEVSDSELEAARSEAWDEHFPALRALRKAAQAAIWAASPDSAQDAATDAVWAAARHTVWAAAGYPELDAEWDAVGAKAWDAAWNAARDAQAGIVKRVLEEALPA